MSSDLLPKLIAISLSERAGVRGNATHSNPDYQERGRPTSMLHLRSLPLLPTFSNSWCGEIGHFLAH